MAGFDRVLHRWRAGRRHVVVLNLHSVSAVRNPFGPALHPELFEILLEFLANRCRVTTFSRLRDEVDPGADGRPLVILSFDDGYFDFLSNAAPALEKHGLRANLNVIVESVETGQRPWHIELQDALGAAPLSVVESLRVPGSPLTLEGTDDRAKQRFAIALSRHIKNLSPQERERVWQPMVGKLARAEKSITKMLTAEDVQRLDSRYEIGAHSYSHQSMSVVDDEYFAADLRSCESFFSKRLGRPVGIYAFPNGSYRQSQIDFLRSRGVDHVLLVDERPSTVTSRVHPRFTFYGQTPAEIRLRSLGHRPLLRK